MDRPFPRRRRPRRAALLVMALPIVGAVLACGGGLSIPKDVYLTQGNKVCAKAAGDWDKLVKKLPKDSVFAQEAYVKDELVPVLEDVIVDLQALGYPEGDQKYLDSIYADATHAISLMKDQPSKDLVERLAGPFAKPAVRFKAYGLKECGNV